ncbi:MAG: hypothetical protein NVS9B15_00900 [Acidobacteriaceae bacterium]
MKHLMLLPALALAATLSAQSSNPDATTTTTTKTKTTSNGHRTTTKRRTKTKVNPVTRQLQEMRSMMEQQQQQIQSMQQQLAQRDQQLQQVQAQAAQATQAVQAAQQAQSSADQANQKADQVAQSVQNVNTEVETVKANAVTTNSTIQAEQTRVGALESPAAIHYKGITITPVGFIAAETVYRNHAIGADINTPFNSTNFPGANAYHQSEIFGSGRQSRLALLVEGKVGKVKGGGYYEGDFGSAGVTSNNNESNSYTFRQRQAWVQAALDNGFTFTAGQQWSLATETRKGLENRQEALPLTIDMQYSVGFSWARQYGFRATKNFHNKFWLGASVENAQTLFAARGAAANFDIVCPGVGGGLYNPTANYSFNQAPDFIVKAAFEPGFGHYEAFGVFRQFRDRVYPNATATPASAAGAFNASRSGQGFGANARWLLAKKHIEIGAHYLGGDGMGRYGTSTLSDATARPDGTLALINSQQGLGSLEFHSNHWDFYAYGGAEYAGRREFFNSAGKSVGYGLTGLTNAGCTLELVPGAGGFLPSSPGSCNADTRRIVEGSFGFWYKIYNGPKGRLQFGSQYSYLTKSAWFSNIAGGGPTTDNNMWLTSFRYYAP